MIKFYNTLTRRKEEFKPIRGKNVGLYTCGLTVYNYAHIGNLRTYIFEDVLKRTLFYNGFKVKHVMNITDVGHLTSDADTGEDKMEKGAAREKKTVWEIASYYTKAFKDDLVKINVLKPDIWCKATDHIKEQIVLVKDLEHQGYTYRLADGIYFNTAKLKSYGRLANINKDKIKPGARIELVKGKKNVTDFALWKFSYPDGRPYNQGLDDVSKRRQMEWGAPWGLGFPGWHIECSAMSRKYLGKVFDIHCGGIDHIGVHHTNEIAQSQAAYGKIPAKYWIHGEHLLLEHEKMAKSADNFITLRTLEQKGYNPLAFRYLVLGTHYRQKLNFSWDSLESSQITLAQIYGFLYNMFLEDKKLKTAKNRQFSKILAAEKINFHEAINDDLNTPRALAVLHKVMDLSQKSSSVLDKESVSVLEELILDFDNVLGLKLKKYLDKGKCDVVPKAVKNLVTRREATRKNKDFLAADKIRENIENHGYEVEDTIYGPRIKKKIS